MIRKIFDKIFGKKFVYLGLSLAVVLGCWLVVKRSYLQEKAIRPSRLLERQIACLALDDPSWNIPVTQEKLDSVNAIFNQPYYYIGQGKQCTAYVSKDGQYVLKFLLQKPLIVKPRFENLPDFFPFTMLKKYKVYKRKKRKAELFSAFMLSYNVVPDETGCLFVHLNSTQSLFKPPMIIDTKGDPVHIDTDKTQFILQKRARHIKPVIIDLMWEQRIDEAKERVDQVLQLLYDSAKKGVVDLDQGLIRNNNIGFTEKRAIYIDTGKLRLKDHKLKRRDFVSDLKRLKPFYKWLRTYYPELAKHFQEKQKQLIDSF